MLNPGLNNPLSEAGAGEEKAPPGGGSLADASATHALNRLAKHKAAQKAWREKNKPHLREYMKEWKGRSDSPEAQREYRAQNKYGVTRRDLMGLLASQCGKCNLCGESLEKERHLDHKIPRSRGGLSEMANYQYLCPPCNMAKHARTTDEYLEHCRRVLLHNGKWWE